MSLKTECNECRKVLKEGKTVFVNPMRHFICASCKIKKDIRRAKLEKLWGWEVLKTSWQLVKK